MNFVKSFTIYKKCYCTYEKTMKLWGYYTAGEDNWKRFVELMKSSKFQYRTINCFAIILVNLNAINHLHTAARFCMAEPELYSSQSH